MREMVLESFADDPILIMKNRRQFKRKVTFTLSNEHYILGMRLQFPFFFNY